MVSNDDYRKFAELDLRQVKIKLMHQSGEGWTQEQADAMEVEYRRFLYLMMKYPDEQTAPREEVDIFWHYHILDTAKYAADCEATFGYFLHHYPYFGMFGEGAETMLGDAGKRMGQLYEEEFGITYDRDILGQGRGIPAPGATAAYCSIPPGAAKAAYCSIPPSAAKAAYCSIPPSAAKAAYCSSPPVGAQAAYCSSPPAGAQAAYCSSPPAGAQAAYCSSPPAGAQAAYCSSPPAGAQAAYCSSPPIGARRPEANARSLVTH
jgi:hypothetical protein